MKIIVEIVYKCLANNKGICKLGLANKCIYNKCNENNQCCRITNFTDYLLIKLLLILDKDD